MNFTQAANFLKFRLLNQLIRKIKNKNCKMKFNKLYIPFKYKQQTINLTKEAKLMKFRSKAKIKSPSEKSENAICTSLKTTVQINTPVKLLLKIITQLYKLTNKNLEKYGRE